MRRVHILVGGGCLIGVLLGILLQGKLGIWHEAADPALQRPSAGTRPLPTLPDPRQDLAASRLLADDEPPEAAPASSSRQSSEIDAQLQTMAANWALVRNEIASLQGRIAALEARPATAKDSNDDDRREQSSVSPTTAERTAALVDAGVASEVAADLLWRRGQTELDRLELRDQALREGWLGDDRYQKEVRRISLEAPNLRNEIGDDAYDRYLFAIGENNRVLVRSTIAGSAAEEAGLRPGDLIESYADTRVFTYTELRDATSAGERDDLIQVQILRDGKRIQAWLPRGPMGVRLDVARTDPSN